LHAGGQLAARIGPGGGHAGGDPAARGGGAPRGRPASGGGVTAPSAAATSGAARSPARRRSGGGVGQTRLPLGAAYAGMLVLLYLPIVLLAVFSLNNGTTLTFPLKGFTLDWYQAMVGDQALLGAARNSLVVATAAATAATALGFAVSQ